MVIATGIFGRMIGIFGGTFDPIHIGHVRTALDIFQDLALDEVRLIPCNVSPHRSAPLASGAQRLAMLQAAIQGEPGLRIDDRELRRTAPSYTVDTLLSLRAELGDTPLCLMMGMDSFQALNTWHRWREIITLAHIVVMTRPGGLPPAHGEVADLVEQHGVYDPARLRDTSAGHVLLRPVSPLDISASRIRTAVQAGKSARYWVPDGVWEIIKKQGIYGANHRF